MQHLRLANANVQGAQYTGALAGFASGSTMAFIALTGAVNGGHDTGGLSGYAYGCTVHTIDADLAVQGSDRTGGLIGYAVGNTTIYHGSARGVVQGASAAGGLVGLIHQALLADSYSRAAVSGNSNVGGAVGYMSATSESSTRAYLTRCYSTGTVTGNSGTGGLVGDVNHAVNNVERYSYWDMDASGLANSSRGAGLATGAMQQQSTYVNYNFHALWAIDEGYGYPVFQALEAYPQRQSVTLDQLAGSGTLADPYVITTLYELDAMRLDLAAAYRLATNLNATATVAWDGGRGWSPVGGSGAMFTGAFDGGGFTISNLTVNRPATSYQGLFGYLAGAHVQHLRLANANVHGAQYTGALAGLASGSTMAFIALTGAVNGGQDTGGLTGYASGCTVHAAAADLTVQGSDRTGGLIGYALGNTTMYHGSARGLARGATSVGGLVGQHHQALLADSYSWADVAGAASVGGAVGHMTGSSAATRAHVYRVYSAGAVTGGGSPGGLVGASGTASVNIVADGYWDTETSGLTNSAAGSGHPTAAMQQASTYTNYNFTTLWTIAGSNHYPVFRELGEYAAPQVISLAQLDGTGTPSDPYLIANASELHAMRFGLTNHYRLVRDVDLADTAIWDNGRGWPPIGSGAGALSFQGSLDGNGYAISNLTINRPTSDYQGLFGYISNADIRNLRLASVSVQSASYAGGLAGFAASTTLEAVRTTGSIKAHGSHAGLALGWGATVYLHRVHADGTVRGADYTGGLAGRVSAAASTVHHSSARGTVAGNTYIGGLIGYLQGGLVADSYSHAAVSATSHVGGLVGVSGYTTTGGSTDAHLRRTYSSGPVSGPGPAVGGLLGTFVMGSVITSYWDEDSSGRTNSARGIGRTTVEMTYPRDTGTTYLEWDFLDVWSEDVSTRNAGYPRLLEPQEHNLVYAAGPGGTLVGQRPQVVASGGDGTPIEAIADGGAAFDRWSDGRADNPRTDTNVTANLSITAHFKSPSQVPIDWYDDRGIQRAEGETWGDVDQRYDPIKQMTLLEQYIAALDPNDSGDTFRVLALDAGPPVSVRFRPGSPDRLYRLLTTEHLADNIWTQVPGAGPRPGGGLATDTLSDTNAPVNQRYYRVTVELP